MVHALGAICDAIHERHCGDKIRKLEIPLQFVADN
jgi:hypothetical protein